MAGMYDVSTTAMQASGQKIFADAQEIKADLNRLAGQLAALEGQWIGDGKMAFTNAQLHYEAANNKLNAALDQISQLVLQNEVQYTGDDAQAQSGLTATGAGMDVSVPGL